MQLSDYLQRIGYTGPVAPDAATLASLLRQHVCSIPFENLDVQLGRPLTTAVDAAYAKIVDRRRGGWCYELNGLFGWALGEVGFEVTRVAAAVMRQVRGDAASANHLCLLVRIPGSADTWFVDVGFGGSLLEPIALRAAEYRHQPYRVSLERLDDGFWRFEEACDSEPFGFDFIPEPGSEQLMSATCDLLQTDPESTFVLNLVAQKRSPDSHTVLRGRVLRRVAAQGTRSQLLESAAELVATLRAEFGLDVPEAEQLWPAIVARHEALFS